ncbi:MAG: hypothetical protein M3332_01670 [Actinomycetota bacterium]|nr:hypothetical protein [Actinomycetota bacterium]
MFTAATRQPAETPRCPGAYLGAGQEFGNDLWLVPLYRDERLITLLNLHEFASFNDSALNGVDYRP